MTLKGTKTVNNLMHAFAGESQARNRYTYYASIAKKEGFVQIQNIFLETANQEKEHAKRLMKFMKLQKEDFSKYNFYLKDIYCTKEHISDSTFLFDKVKYNNDNFIYLRIDSSQIVKQEKIHSSSVKLYN